MKKIPLIETREASFERGGRQIASDISIKLYEGDIYFIKVKNGSGKTTFLRCLLGFVPIYSGKIIWFGEEVFPSINFNYPAIAWLGHLNALKSVFSVQENLNFYANIWRVNNEKVRNAVEILSFEEYLQFPVSWLSAGEKRRLSLIRLIFCPAKIWLLDEPSSFLDDFNKMKLENIMKNHISNGGSIVCSTHDSIEISNSKTLFLGKEN